MYGQGSGVMAGATSQAGGYPNQDTTVARQGEVVGEMERLRNVGDQLGAAVQMLVKRLDPVRRQTGSLKGENVESAPEPVLCAVASGIRTERQNLERVLVVVSAALVELEI